MNFVRRVSALAFVACVLQLASVPATAQGKQTEASSVITGTRVAVAANSFSGPLYVVAGGKETRIAADAIAAWVIAGGRKVVYSGRDGAGGYENEGQSLRIYDARTGRHRQVMSGYFEVDTITEVAVGTNRTALLVAMSDSGLGASNVAVVDPERGEVFFRQ